MRLLLKSDRGSATGLIVESGRGVVLIKHLSRTMIEVQTMEHDLKRPWLRRQVGRRGGDILCVMAAVAGVPEKHS